MYIPLRWCFLGLFSLGWALGLSVATSGCGAQAALSAQAQAVHDAQPARFAFYEDRHAECLQRLTLEEYTDCMGPAVHVARAADSYREALHSAQDALDAGSGGAAIPCVISAAVHLVDALRAANVPIPSEVSEIAAMVPQGVCRGRE